MANRKNTSLSDEAIYKDCPQYFPIPPKQALIMFLQPDEEFRALQGVKKEKYLRPPPRPQNFNCMATNLARQYQTNQGLCPAIINLNQQFREDIQHPVRLPGVSFPVHEPPNRPNVLVGGVNLNQTLLDIAAQVQALGTDHQQQGIVNAANVAALQAAAAQGIATQQQLAQVQAQLGTAQTQIGTTATSLLQTHQELLKSDAFSKWLTMPKHQRQNAWRNIWNEIDQLAGIPTRPSHTASEFKQLDASQEAHLLISTIMQYGGNIQTGDMIHGPGALWTAPPGLPPPGLTGGGAGSSSITLTSASSAP